MSTVLSKIDWFCTLHNDGHLSWVAYGNEAAEAARKTSDWPALSDIALDGYSLIVGLTTDGSVVATDYNALVETGSYWGNGPARLSDGTMCAASTPRAVSIPTTSWRCAPTEHSLLPATTASASAG